MKVLDVSYPTPDMKVMYCSPPTRRVVLVGISLDPDYLGQCLSLQTISSYIKQDPRLSSITIETASFHAGQQPYDIAGKIHEMAADIISFSCYMWNISVVLATCQILKEINKKARIILGGPEVTYHATTLLKTFKAIDIIIVGEGENTFASLLSAVQLIPEDLRNIKGIVFRESNTITDTGLPNLIDELDTIPIMHTYHKDRPGSGKNVYYCTTRGCPFHCGFCLGGKEKRIRSLSLARVKDDLLELVKARCEYVHIIDWTFNHNIERAKEIFRFILEHNINTTFVFEIRTELIDQETLFLLNRLEDKTFSFIFEIGIQSVHQETLKKSGRYWKKDKASKILSKLCTIPNLYINFNLLRGLPGDSYETFKAGIDYLYQFPHLNLDSGVLCLIPGSDLRREYLSMGLKFNPNPPYQVLCTEEFSLAELCRAEKLIEVESVLRSYEEQTTKIRQLFELTPSQFFENFPLWLANHTSINIHSWRGLHRDEATSVLAHFFCDYISNKGFTPDKEPEIHQLIKAIICGYPARDPLGTEHNPSSMVKQ